MKICPKCNRRLHLSRYRLRSDGEGFYAICSDCTIRQEEKYPVTDPKQILSQMTDIALTRAVLANRPIKERLRDAVRR
jgi:hypothetical protein